MIACLVDLARLIVYGAAFASTTTDRPLFILLAAAASASAGTLIGNLVAQKTTIETIRIIVSIMVLGNAVGLTLGIV